MADASITLSWDDAPATFESDNAAYLVKSITGNGYTLANLERRHVAEWKNWVDNAIKAAQNKDYELAALLNDGDAELSSLDVSGTTQLDGTVTIGDGSSSTGLNLNSAAGDHAINFQNNGSSIWQLRRFGSGAFAIRRVSGGVNSIQVNASNNLTFGEDVVAHTVADADFRIGTAGGAPTLRLARIGSDDASFTFSTSLSADTANDKRIVQVSTNEFAMQHHNGSSWENLATFADGGITFERTVTLGTTGNSIGVLGATPIARQTVTGSRGGNAALASLLTAMESFGWITDSTTA